MAENSMELGGSITLDGFKDIEPYEYFDIKGMVYLELKLV